MSRRRTPDEQEQREWLRRNVRARRAELRLTVKAASARVKMHWRHWQKIEACEVNVTLATLVRLGEALEMSVLDLLRKPRGTAAR